MIITKEKQQQLSQMIESAFKKGSGDCFMQRNEFEEIIAVHKSEVDTKEMQGFKHFILTDINRPVKVIAKPIETIQEPIKPYKHIPRESALFNFLDEFPEFYNHCGL